MKLLNVHFSQLFCYFLLGSSVTSANTFPFKTETKSHTHTQTIGKIMVLCNIVRVSVGNVQEDKEMWTEYRQVYL